MVILPASFFPAFSRSICRRVPPRPGRDARSFGAPEVDGQGRKRTVLVGDKRCGRLASQAPKYVLSSFFPTSWPWTWRHFIFPVSFGTSPSDVRKTCIRASPFSSLPVPPFCQPRRCEGRRVAHPSFYWLGDIGSPPFRSQRQTCFALCSLSVETACLGWSGRTALPL